MSAGSAGGGEPGARTRRLFAALVPPLELRQALVRAAREALAPAAGNLRFYPPEHVHLTLCFLGEVPEGLLEGLDRALARAVARCPAGPLALCVRGGAGFPSTSAARVAWAGVTDDAARGRAGALAALHALLEEELASLGCPGAEHGRSLRPHLTLARARAPVALPLEFTGLSFERAWSADEVLWVESRLERPAAERYAVLARHAFAKA